MAKTEKYWSFGGVKVHADSASTHVQKDKCLKSAQRIRVRKVRTLAWPWGEATAALEAAIISGDAACVHRLRGHIAAGT